jgi:hypothetical protein
MFAQDFWRRRFRLERFRRTTDACRTALLPNGSHPTD